MKSRLFALSFVAACAISIAANAQPSSVKPMTFPVTQGKTYKFEKIADELNLSVKTVSTYRTRILEKMAMKSNADLTYYAIKNGLIE